MREFFNKVKSNIVLIIILVFWVITADFKNLSVFDYIMFTLIIVWCIAMIYFSIQFYWLKIKENKLEERKKELEKNMKEFEEIIEKGEHKKAIVIATKFILRGDNVEDVIEITELSKDEVLRLKNKIELKKN